MTIYTWVVVACWLIFLIYWIVLGINAKRSLKENSRHLVMRIITLIAMLVVLAVLFSTSGHLFNYRLASAEHPELAAIGSLLCAFGILICIWARTFLGRNWGMPQSVKESPELVTSGPYAFVRHPIYTGVILAMIGTGLVTNSLVWLALILAYCAYFIYSSYKEEKNLLRTFPDIYPAYMQRTKRLIPFIY